MPPVDAIVIKLFATKKKSPATSTSKVARYWGPISILVFLISVLLVRHPAVFDWPVTSAINHLSNSKLNKFFGAIRYYATLSGVPLMAVVWACWFSDESTPSRAKLVGAIAIAFPAGIVSRLMQRHWDSHLRPFFDHNFAFKIPSNISSNDFVTPHSFPSDHATIYAALVVAVFLVRPFLGWFALVWLVVVEISRVYIGAHWPSDLIGGAGLAAVAVWATRAPWISAGTIKLVEWARANPAVFYFCAFCLTYEVADLFFDVRGMVGHY